ncbi:phosphatase PAP2 family protein [Sphingomonas sp. Leaf4]|uniref:phosphatase PAP2 family protein n=1 Tax=Sphingomonas sp. Leaf4 TaxID=2876553 RepID=UPI001E38DAC4|nr:phosphatase PAP2 family protein [Sphingomonas sp. Leaf4]
MPAAALHAMPIGCQRPFAVGAVPVYLFLLLGWVGMPIALHRTGLHIAVDEFAMFGGMMLGILWFAWCLRARGLLRLATMIEGYALFTAICATVCLLTFVLAAGPHPYFDGALARADRILLPGFDWPRAMLAFDRSGLPVRIANIAYASIGWQPALLIALHALGGRHRRLWHFLAAWVLTLCVVMAFFAHHPALGAYHHFGIAAAQVPAMLDPVPWNQPRLLLALQDGTIGTISFATLDGIINYPSFHAGAAVLLGYGFWHLPPLRWPFALLNALMLAAAVPIGGHYVVDLVAGILAAAIGIVGGRWMVDQVSPASTTAISAPPTATPRA